MSHIPEKIHNQRMKLQLQSIESPSELPGRKWVEQPKQSSVLFINTFNFRLFLSDGSKSKSFTSRITPHSLRSQLDSIDSPVHLTGYRLGKSFFNLSRESLTIRGCVLLSACNLMWSPLIINQTLMSFSSNKQWLEWQCSAGSDWNIKMNPARAVFLIQNKNKHSNFLSQAARRVSLI